MNTSEELEQAGNEGGEPQAVGGRNRQANRADGDRVSCSHGAPGGISETHFEKHCTRQTHFKWNRLGPAHFGIRAYPRKASAGEIGLMLCEVQQALNIHWFGKHGFQDLHSSAHNLYRLPNESQSRKRATSGFGRVLESHLEPWKGNFWFSVKVTCFQLQASESAETVGGHV